MVNSYSKQIQERIKSSPDGTIFINSDFTDIADAETVRRNLNRLVKTGALQRVMNGMYLKPKYSKLLGKYLFAKPDDIANALARRYGWTIAPNGVTALNMLGLSTQVPASHFYVSDGPYRTYHVKAAKLHFEHGASKDIRGLSYVTALVVQALKAIGKEKVTEDDIKILSYKLSDEDKAKILSESAHSTSWIHGIIKRIVKGDIDNEKVR